MPTPNESHKIIVRVRHGDSLGDAMCRIRSWLDDQKIETAGFTTAAKAGGYTFTIGFQSSADADRFRHQFAR